MDVHYVDFGNESSVPIVDLRRMKEEFFTFPVLVRRFKSVVWF